MNDKTSDFEYFEMKIKIKAGTSTFNEQPDSKPNISQKTVSIVDAYAKILNEQKINQSAVSRAKL